MGCHSQASRAALRARVACRATRRLTPFGSPAYDVPMADPEISRGQLLRLTFLFEGGLGVVACIVGWLLGYRPWETLRWEAIDLAIGMAASLPLLVLFS